MADALPEVTQDFEANTGPYVAAILAAAAAAEKFAAANHDAVVSLAGLQAAISALHGKDVSIGVDVAGAAAAAQAAAQLATAATQAGQADSGLATAAVAAARATDTQKSSTVGAVAATSMFMVGLKAVHLGLTVFGAQLAADAAGFIAFGVAAISAFAPIVSNWGTLTTTWAALNGEQQNAVLSLQHFMDLMRGGSQQGVFTVFNEGLALAESLLKGTGGVTAQASQALMGFFAELKTTFGSSGWQALLAGTGSIIRQDMSALLGLLNSVVMALPAFIHGFNDVGLAVLHGASGLVSFVGGLLNLNRGLSTFAAGASAVLTTWSLLAHFISVIPGPMAVLGPLFGRLAAQVALTGAAFTGARLLGMGPFAAALAAIGGPEVAVAAGLVALAAVAVGLAIAFGSTASATEQLIASVQRLDAANQFSVAVWQQGQAALVKQTTALQATAGAAQQWGGKSLIASNQSQQLSNALMQQNAGVTRLAANYAFLENTYGVSAAQARALMIAINLGSGALTGNSAAAQQNRFMIANWIKTQQQALSPMSQFAFDMRQMARDAGNLNQQVLDLTNAFKALSGPTISAMQATATFKTDMIGLHQAIQANGTVVGVATQKQAALTTALATAAQQAMVASAAIKANGGSAQAAAAPLEALRRTIERAGLSGQAAAALVAQLNAEIAALHSKTITLTINTVHTGGGVSGIGGATPGVKQPGAAAGTPSAPPGLMWVGEQGPELMSMAGGERVYPAGQSAAIARSGGGGPTVVNVHLHIAGSVLAQHDLQAAVQKAALDYFTRNPGNGLGPLWRR